MHAGGRNTPAMAKPPLAEIEVRLWNNTSAGNSKQTARLIVVEVFMIASR
jgi:hypothetical protein